MAETGQIVGIFQSIGIWEMVFIGVIALLIFGRRLPEVGRSLGKSIVEFKRGLSDISDDIKAADSNADPAAKSRQFNEPPKRSEP